MLLLQLLELGVIGSSALLLRSSLALADDHVASDVTAVNRLQLRTVGSILLSIDGNFMFLSEFHLCGGKCWLKGMKGMNNNNA